MKPLKVLAAIDDVGHLKEPMYVTVPVTHRGADVMHVKNHADYVDWRGLYKILKYLQDFKGDFPALCHVGSGQVCPHITTEVDFELLFSQSWFIYEPRQARTVIHMYERLLAGKHCINRIN